ncbi:MAG: hypothetical protein GXY83_36155 [Rhodopirellula sp.]|nr:hypothetical protein [Rhodopirellula sp.]
MPRKRLWHALESVPGLTTVAAEWKALAVPDHDTLRSFLRPNGSLAASYPCRQCGCAHEVVVHGEDDIVAACRCESQCPNIALTRSDIILYEVNRSALGKAVASALGITVDEAPVDGLHQTARIGFYSPFAGYRFPVLLTLQYEPDDMRMTVERLAATVDAAFILLAPTAQLLSPATEDLLRRKSAMFISLADALDADEVGKFEALPRCEELLAEFRSRHVPQADATSTAVFFPTPADAEWKDVTIRFVDGHTVAVKVKDKTGVYHYSQMGMADRRNTKPTKQWDLLRDFVEAGGLFTWSHRNASKKMQKHRELLAVRLKDFFRIDGDPFEYVEDEKGWRARFKIMPDS